MTLIRRRAVPGPATHAFVIGIGGYPSAKPGHGGDPILQGVPDIPSAAGSAKLVADWLLENQDSLAAPLASLEVLIGEAPTTPPAIPYAWSHVPAKPIAKPTLANVTKAGKAWLARLNVREGDVALFYICGHGARLGSEPIVFLTDLNSNPLDRWGAYVNLGMVASAFKQQAKVKAAFFFSDACQEFLPRLELIRTGGGARFIEPLDAFRLNDAREKVALLSATSDGRLAYEGDWSGDPNVKIGRFTQTLLVALGGASARQKAGRWVVYPGGLFEDLKLLHRLRPEWRDRPFEPSQGLSPNEVLPIVNSADPRIPILVQTDPADAMSLFAMSIFADLTRAQPALTQAPAGGNGEWLSWLRASTTPHVVVAQGGADGGSSEYQAVFVPMAPIFDQKVRVA